MSWRALARRHHDRLAFGRETDGARLTSFNFAGGLKIMEGMGLEVHLRQALERQRRLDAALG